MTFEDTNVGDLINATFHKNDKQITLTSTIISIVDNSLVVEPFYINNLAVSFPSDMDIELMVHRANDIPCYWQRVRIDKKLYHESQVHVITTKLPGVKVNRRNNFRVPIAESCKINGYGSRSIGGHIKDLSVSGFAFTVPSNIDIPLHQKITLEYIDSQLQKSFELAGRPIRKLETDNFTIYGCILDRSYNELSNYLMQKQAQIRPNATPTKKASSPIIPEKERSYIRKKKDNSNELLRE